MSCNNSKYDKNNNISSIIDDIYRNDASNDPDHAVDHDHNDNVSYEHYKYSICPNIDFT